MVLGAGNSHDAVRVNRLHPVAQDSRGGVSKWTVRMVVLVVQVEQDVPVLAQRSGHRVHRLRARRLGTEDGEGLTGKLSWTKQHELQNASACPETFGQPDEPRAARRGQSAVGLIDRFVP